MAVFRAITAEEEAASGVMRCLIELKYPGAETLNPHDHMHKHVLFPYLDVLQLFFGQTLQSQFSKYHLHIKEEDGTSRLTIALSMNINGEPQLMYPVPPLNFGLTNPDTGEAPAFSFQINQLIAARGRASVKAFLKSEANVRNQVLYAWPDGYPVIPVVDESFILERRRRVLAMINVYLLVQPYPEHQPFVSQALLAFTRMLGQFKRKSGAA